VNRVMRRFDEALQIFGKPMIAACLPALAVHALLNDHPASIVGDDETMEVEIKPVLHRGAVDLGDEPARFGQSGTIKADAIADNDEFLRRLPRMPTASTADMDTEFTRERTDSMFQRSDDGGGNARRMPVHAHDGTERLEP